MRTALRASITTAVLAGALLAPVAGTAYAATTAQAAAATAPARYAGTPVLIDTGVVAVLRNASEGPEVWIRAVSADWKPGDDYMSRVLAVLDVEHPKASVSGLELRLVKEDPRHPSLTVAKGGTTKSYPLPQAPAAPADCVSEVKQVTFGAELQADLTMSPKGPVFEWKTQGGDNVPSGFANFPALPKGCTLDYQVHDDAPADCVSEVKQFSLGAGLMADLTMSPKGPSSSGRPRAATTSRPASRTSPPSPRAAPSTTRSRRRPRLRSPSPPPPSR
ncbi:hypothetical protein [Streptomyces sp. NRRL S-575]|uniref:hypothetical protein n=1 Tax=Streptomyces sp. NRRL S-575 TaxID=1463915 RepID=UPI0004C4B17F|nr:hypothetical protein [Streptomyces sp. NRRL S-575]